MREIDTIARWGGEEFVILLHRTSSAEASVVAERLSTAIEAKQLETSKGLISRTVSIGIAASTAGTQTLEELLGKADQAMLQAKQAGRNQICTYQTPEEDTKLNTAGLNLQFFKIVIKDFLNARLVFFNFFRVPFFNNQL